MGFSSSAVKVSLDLHPDGFPHPQGYTRRGSAHPLQSPPPPSPKLLTSLCSRFAVADTVYRALRTERRDQAVMISGESGAGKTEATKRLLQFYAETCPAPERGGAVRDRLLQSNPVLEAFGNARTLRNDNSSRFGKYMDVQFDFKGAPVGGHILSYLLEKSRVVHQNHGERNFHVFYQLLEGGEEETLRRLGLERNPQSYLYLVKGQCAKVSSINDKNDWKVVRKALTVIDFTEDEVEDLLSIVASVLHLGNLHFAANEESNAQVTTENQLKYLTRLLGVEGSTLREALTHRKIIAKGEELLSPLNLEQAAYARDALAKAVYSRTFTWLVAKINRSLASKDAESPSWRSTTVLGLLDIYGFEVFQHNSFEQFCINYCNEKLQQLFIELTLKSEQEEYEAEGIAWEPVQYFNNKIICDLVEEKFKGIISILDEECLRPGEATDLTFLEKLEDTVKHHPHFLTHKLADQRTRKSLGRGEFRLLHYAGEVTYSVTGFLDKNNDLLFRNLKETMCSSENPIMSQCFDRSELSDKKRPETVATQFKMSLLQLVEILKSKEPAYVRCIKPNDAKQPGRFDEVLIRHQVKYLGLMENLRVRRAGFAYRRKYEAFLQRYKSLCPETWPTWAGRPQDGVAVLIRHLGYKPEEYKMGRTKIFIRFPKTLFATEDALEVRRQSLATKIQAAWRGFHWRQKFLRVKRSAICIQSWWRGTLGRRKAAKRKWAAQTIRRLIRGFILRHEPRCPQNAFFLDHVRTSFLLNLRRQLPRNILDPSWPTPPPALREVCGPSLLTREPPTPSAEGLDNHVTRGASGREGKGPGAGLRGTTREWRGGPGRGGVASACRLPGRGGGARLPGCPDLACAPRPRSSCGSSAGRTWCGSTAGASAPSGSSRYGRGDPGDQPGAAGNVPARRTFTWIYHVTSSGSQLRFRLMHEAEAGEDSLWPVGFIGHTSSPDWEGLPRARC
uniref:Unconventional myosin-Ic n=1 Tax=Sus scrofa TaxID=9823 RepID=A0A480N6C4_PIG